MKEFCPKCKRDLVAGDLQRFETLVEHVSDPNAFMYREPPLRPTLVCPNRCYGASFWDHCGDAYSVPGAIRRFLWRLTDYRWPAAIAVPDLR